MTTKARSRPVGKFPALEPITELLSTPALTTEDRLIHIRALGQRLDGYIQFMCSVGEMNGCSAEAKQEAVAIFYECLVSFERELGRIQECFRLR